MLHLRLIRFIGMVVPRRLRADWRQEWEAELLYREALLAEWDRLDRRSKLDLLRRSLGAFRDAMLLQPRRLEDEMFQDLRFGLRMLGKKPGLVLAAVFCLAVGIGANITVFSFFNAMLLKPISGVQLSDQLVVAVRTRNAGIELSSYPDYLDFRDRNQVFSGMLAYRSTNMNLSGGDLTERLYGGVVSGNYFSVLGVQAALGRTFHPEEDQTPGIHPVAVISHGLWQRRFGADPAIIGQTIRLNSHPFTIIGVAAADFIGTETGEVQDIWVPLMMQALAKPQPSESAGEMLSSRGKNWLILIGRLKPGFSLANAQAEMDVLASQLRQAHPEEFGKSTGIKLSPHVGLGPIDYPIVINFLGLILAIVGLVLLIACANVANLLLVRAASRRKEVAIRLALGARRLRIVRQFLTESFLIAALGAIIGLLIPFLVKDRLLSLFKNAVNPASIDFTPDYRVIVYTIALSLTMALLFGLPPAIQASRRDFVPALKDSFPTRGRRHWRLSSIFVAAQIAISLALLVGAGLMVRTLQKVYATDLGFEIRNMLTLTFDLKLQGHTEQQNQQFYRQLLERTATLPGVKSAGLASILPLGWGSNPHEIIIDGAPPQPDGRPLTVHHNVITPGYFQMMGIPLIAGRDFGEQEKAGVAGTAIINETMAHRFWNDKDPVGKRFELGGQWRRAVEIIGVVRTGKYFTLYEDDQPVMYLPLSQNYASYMTLHLRTDIEPSSLIAVVRGEAYRLDPNLPFIEIKTLEQQLNDSFWPARAVSTVIIIFGALALLLAVIGLYGVISYTVAQRTREIGIRIALGANPGNVLKMVIWQGFKLGLIGCAIGLPAAFALARFMSNFIYGVSPRDPVTFALISCLLCLVVLLASYVPARRAARVDPMSALRHE
jgi:predicted permease